MQAIYYFPDYEKYFDLASQSAGLALSPDNVKAFNKIFSKDPNSVLEIKSRDVEVDQTVFDLWNSEVSLTDVMAPQPGGETTEPMLTNITRYIADQAREKNTIDQILTGAMDRLHNIISYDGYDSIPTHF